MEVSNSSSTASSFNRLGLLLFLILYSLNAAYTIRLNAISTFGRVIHEFDPYFNFRATEVRAMNYSLQIIPKLFLTASHLLLFFWYETVLV